MSNNIVLSNLDFPQVLRNAHMEDAQALRAGAMVAFAVNVQPNASTGAVTASISNCAGARNLNMYCVVGASALSTAASATIQFSPSDSDAVWLSAGLSLASATAAASANSGTAVSALLARRIQFVLNTPPSGGDVTYYVVGS